MALYHTAQGSVSYTVVGSPTIVDGVAGGFDNNNRLQLNSTYSATNTKNTKWRIRFKTPSTITSSFNPIIKRLSDENDFVFGIWTYGNYLFVVRLGSQNGNDLFFNDIYLNNGDVLPNTWYVCEVTGNNGIWKAEIFSDDGTSLGSDVKDFSSYTVSVDYNIVLQPMSSDGNYSGSIDLNNTYISVNGQPWFGTCPVEVKKHQIQGANGYTVVGNPTIVDGVASGFSGSNYLQLSQNWPSITENDSFEIVAKCQLPSTVARETIIGSLNNDNTTYDICIQIVDEHNIYFYIYDNHISDRKSTNAYSSTSLAGKTLYLKYLVTNNTLTGKISLDESTWIENSVSLASGFTYTKNSPAVFGYGTGFNSFNGSIDLNHTYIKVNGSLWFYQPQETKYIIRENPSTQEQHLVYAKPNMYLSGPVNYTTVGTPTIVDNVASGFSDSDYLQLSQTVPAGTAKTYEIYIKFTTPSSITEDLGCLIATSTYFNYGLRIINIGGNKGTLRGQARSNSAYYTVDSQSGYILPSTTYYAKLFVDGENGTMTLRISSDMVTWSETTAIYSTGVYNDGDILWQVGRGVVNATGEYGPSKCSIDLNETYIKVNGSLWFYGKNYSSKNIAPIPAGYHTKGQVGCVAVGSPTVTDGVVSNLTGGNYLSLASFPFTSDWEMVVNATTTGTAEEQRCVYRSSDFQLRSGVINAQWNVYIAGNTYWLGNNDTYNPTNYPYVKIIKQNGYISVWLSSDGVNFTKQLDNISASTITDGDLYMSYPSGSEWSGSINLNETYIKVNNELWFDGKGQYPFTGYIDMRTQEFHPAPAGTGYNEVPQS